MLVATRDPMPQPGAPDPSAHRHERDFMGHPAPRTARMMGVLQLAGSFLAIPVALGSAYSVYQANFSPDTQCQQLRANIIAMIDKKIDAATRRMLVRRDVETFEKTCGAFDPDAKAAFVTLLAEPRGTPLRAVVVPKAEAPKDEPAKAEAVKAEPAPAAVKAEAAKPEAPAKEVARKPELRPSVTAKQTPAPAVPAAAAAEPVQRDAVVSDASWLASVRGALVNHDPEQAAAVQPARPSAAPPAAWPTPENRAVSQPPAAPVSLAPPATSAPVASPEAIATSAPALPPATSVSTMPAQRADPDHPVPPGSIPENTASTENSGWVAKIPFVGQVLAR